MKQYTISDTVIKEISTVLGQLPFSQVFEVIGHLEQELAPQLNNQNQVSTTPNPGTTPEPLAPIK